MDIHVDIRGFLEIHAWICYGLSGQERHLLFFSSEIMSGFRLFLLVGFLVGLCIKDNLGWFAVFWNGQTGLKHISLNNVDFSISRF